MRDFRSQAANRPFPKIPKVRQQVQMTLAGGEMLAGHVFIEATSRIQDLLNSTTNFIPFIDETETLLLINKSAIVQMRPVDD